MAPSSLADNRITKLTNCRILRDASLVWEDLWISSTTGTIINPQTAFYDDLILPSTTVDLGGRIVSPGFIDCQLNGAFGFNFSTVLPSDSYADSLQLLNTKLVETGVTSYLPTVTSQTAHLYHTVLPHLAPSPSRNPHHGSSSLGAHVEGPFLSPLRAGIHNPSVLLAPSTLSDMHKVYGPSLANGTITLLTLAPELGSSLSLIPSLSQSVTISIGHTDATYKTASSAITLGAKMITHLFNAMRPLHHRDPGVFGVLGGTAPKPYFGMIADGCHIHPATIKIAYAAHPGGFILVTDAMHMAGLEEDEGDGEFEWTNGDVVDVIEKRGGVLRLRKDGGIAGSCVMLVDCVNNFLRWTGVGVGEGLRAVTETPARMLGLERQKGTLEAGADADLVVLRDEVDGDGGTSVVVDEVWKFGVRVFQRDGLP
ncbi:hypothetical protein OQA88_10065 [Cercophora sp. LCS_1]